jgi:hypothetical protein
MQLTSGGILSNGEDRWSLHENCMGHVRPPERTPTDSRCIGNRPALTVGLPCQPPETQRTHTCRHTHSAHPEARVACSGPFTPFPVQSACGGGVATSQCGSTSQKLCFQIQTDNLIVIAWRSP